MCRINVKSGLTGAMPITSFPLPWSELEIWVKPATILMLIITATLIAQKVRDNFSLHRNTAG
jgi:hypothetical protein